MALPTTGGSSRPGLPETRVALLPPELPADIIVLDVREDHEWVAGHAPGAIHVPLGHLAERWADVAEAVGERQLLVVCHVGQRSAAATAALTAAGLDAVNLAGGMQQWALAGRPLVSEIGVRPHVG